MDLRRRQKDKHRSATEIPSAFTLIELLVVIAIITLLVAVLVPVLNRARELGQRAVCLSNLKQLTLAWTLYAEVNDGRLVSGAAFARSEALPRRRVRAGWVGEAFLFPESRSELIENPDKGALWPDIRDIDIYRCPRGRAGHAVTYTTVISANGMMLVEGTYKPTEERNWWLVRPGKRVGKTVLRLSKLSDIISPGASERAVFMDHGQSPASTDFYIHYLNPHWRTASPPPIHHAKGVALSMADGHAEHWKWNGQETVSMPRKLRSTGRWSYELLAGWPDQKDYMPQTEGGLYDLQRLQKATWGRLGY